MANIFVAADAILGAATIRQITNADHKTNMEIRKAMNSGGHAVQQVSGKAAGEITSLTSGDIAGLVALNANAFVSAGYAVAAGTVTVPYKLRSSGATFASGSSHPWLTGSDAFVVPTLFEVSQDADFATCQFDVHWLSSDGLTKACDDATGNALGAQSFSGEFALGPCYINGTLLDGVQSFRVTPGIEVVKPPLGSGSVWPTFASIKTAVPTIEITVNDFGAIAGTVGDFTAMTSANCYMRKRLDAGLYAAAISTVDVRFTFAGGLTDTNSVVVSNNDDGTATITLHGKTLTASAAVAVP